MSTKNTAALIGTLLVILAGVFSFARFENIAPQTIITTPVTTVSTSTATLTIAERSYSVAVTQGETVLDAMRALKAAGTFLFTGRDYPGLGFFVDSINGVSNAGGKYWVFYVNGVSATVGVSSQKIIRGDIIEWRYEKSY